MCYHSSKTFAFINRGLCTNFKRISIEASLYILFQSQNIRIMEESNFEDNCFNLLNIKEKSHDKL